MKITVLGSGTSQGVPVIGCKCDVCISKAIKDKRLRCSILITTDTTQLVIDTGPDFRQQMLTNDVSNLDAVVFTHEHKDHIAGLDDVRAYNFIQKRPMPFYCTNQVKAAIHREFHYAFESKKYPGVPELTFKGIEAYTPFKINDLEIEPFLLQHLHMPVMGFKLGTFAYVTDANFIPKKSESYLYNLDVLIINALRKETHPSHFTLSEALELIVKYNPKKAYLTHISHQLGTHEAVEAILPQNVALAFDGLTFKI